MMRLAYTMWSLPRLQRYATLALLGAFFSGGIFYLASGLALPDSVEATLSDEQVVTLTGRTLIWQATVEQWKLNPLFGYGPNLWDLQMSMANVPTIGFVASHAHNQVLQTLGEAGIVGVVGLLLYVVALLAYGVRYARGTNVVALALVSVMLLRGITEPSLSHTIGASDFYGHFLIFTYLVLASRHDNLMQSCNKTGLASRGS